jgi:8-oxo-dGTP pyrophosphatase MutT (NUDIX family)
VSPGRFDASAPHFVKRPRGKIDGVAGERLRVTWDGIRGALAGRAPEPILSCSRRAAVALVLRDAAPSIELLFIARAVHPDDPWSGHIAFPGGRSEEGESSLRTAVRESAEEVGIDLEAAELLGPLDELQAVRRVPIDLAIAPFVFRVPEGTAVVAGPEVQCAFWIPLDDLMGERYRGTFDYSEGDSVLRFPCFRVEERVIWGLTYRMFSELSMRLRTAGIP